MAYKVRDLIVHIDPGKRLRVDCRGASDCLGPSGCEHPSAGQDCYASDGPCEGEHSLNQRRPPALRDFLQRELTPEPELPRTRAEAEDLEQRMSGALEELRNLKGSLKDS